MPRDERVRGELVSPESGMIDSMARGAFVVAALLLCGCSFFATQSPRSLPEPPSCTVSKGPPGLDALISMTSIFTGTGFGIASALTDNKDRETQYAATAGVLTLTGIVTLTSALVGAYRVHRCARATKEYEALQLQRYAPPAPGYGAPPGSYPPPSGYPPPPPPSSR
jgi:hypothetical protein